MERTASNLSEEETPRLIHGMNDLVPEGAELPPSMGLNIPNLRPAPKPTRLKHAPPSTKLYHASSIDESQEVESESDMNRESESEGALSRLSSYDTMGIHWLDAEKLRPVDGNRLEAPTALQAWDSDILDLPVGQGRPANQKKLCILSLDGGGMRGLIAARILTRLEHLIQAKVGTAKVHLADYFDLFSGTSTGAVLSTMLVTPDEKGEPLFTAEGCCEFYQKHGKYIFQSRWYDPFHGSLRQLYRPKYSARRFENLLKLYTVRNGEELTLLDTLKPIVVTSFDISKATPFFFMRHAAMKDPSRNFRLWEVCRATAAAPTYFPPAYVTSVDGTVNGTLIDGGAIQNNPALVATTHALSNNDEFPDTTSLQDILVCVPFPFWCRFLS
jgi:predicted acylesterase/phospholipase RssA